MLISILYGRGIMSVPKFYIGDIVELKKQHPCGNKLRNYKARDRY